MKKKKIHTLLAASNEFFSNLGTRREDKVLSEWLASRVTKQVSPRLALRFRPTRCLRERRRRRWSPKLVSWIVILKNALFPLFQNGEPCASPEAPGRWLERARAISHLRPSHSVQTSKIQGVASPNTVSTATSSSSTQMSYVSSSSSSSSAASSTAGRQINFRYGESGAHSDGEYLNGASLRSFLSPLERRSSPLAPPSFISSISHFSPPFLSSLSVFPLLLSHAEDAKVIYDNLDMHFITGSIIGMSKIIPVSNSRPGYKCNDDVQVSKLISSLTEHDGRQCLLFNLSDDNFEKENLDAVGQQCVDLGWLSPGSKSQTPSIPHIFDICYQLQSFLTSNSANLAMLLCSNGKTRTGIVIACYLKYSMMCDSSLDGFNVFCDRRCSNMSSRASISKSIPPSLKQFFRNFDDCCELQVSPPHAL